MVANIKSLWVGKLSACGNGMQSPAAAANRDLAPTAGAAQWWTTPSQATKIFPVTHSEAEWHKILTSDRLAILHQALNIFSPASCYTRILLRPHSWSLPTNTA